MTRTVRLRDGEYEILGEAVAVAPGLRVESGGVLGPVAAAKLLRRSVSDPSLARSLQLALTDYLGVHELLRRSDRDVLDEFARLLTTGRVALRRVKMRTPPAAWPAAESEAEPEESVPPPPPPTDTLTWIEIVLVDEEDQPVVGENCELTGPDGARLGPYKTDAYGRVLIDQIEPGTYNISFTELDEASWEAA